MADRQAHLPADIDLLLCETRWSTATPQVIADIMKGCELTTGSDIIVDNDVGWQNWIIAILIPGKPKLTGVTEIVSGSSPVDSDEDLMQSYQAELVSLAVTTIAVKLLGANSGVRTWKMIYSFDNKRASKDAW